MAGKKYPAVLPPPVRDGYGKVYTSELRKTKMDDGNWRTRRRHAFQPFSMTLTWKLSDEELGIFEGFGAIICTNWTDWFALPLIPGDPTIDVKIIGDAPEFKREGADWVANATVMAIEAPPPMPGVISMPVWPSSLPWPEQDEYGYQVENFLVQDDPMQGYPRSRNRFMSKATMFPATWILTKAERDIFWSFFRNTLLDGTMAFMLPFMNGLGINYVRCKVVAQPKESSSSSGFKIVLNLTTMFAPVMTESQLMDALNAYLVSDYAIDYFAEDYTVGTLVYD